MKNDFVQKNRLLQRGVGQLLKWPTKWSGDWRSMSYLSIFVSKTDIYDHFLQWCFSFDMFHFGFSKADFRFRDQTGNTNLIVSKYFLSDISGMTTPVVYCNYFNYNYIIVSTFQR